MPSLIDNRIHAAIEAKQHETLLRVEGTADKAAAIASRAGRDALQLVLDGSVIHRNQREAAAVLKGIFPAISAILDQQFRRLHYWSYDETVRIFAKQIPRRWFRRAVPAAVTVGETDGLPIPGMDIWADTFTEPVVGKRLSDADWTDFLKQHLFPPPSREQVDRAVYANVAGMNWQQRLGDLSHKVADMDRLAGTLATGASSGMGQAELKRQIQPIVQNISSSASRIARTEGLRIATSAQREQYADLGDMLAGVQIVATLDENTRPAHAARNGRIYWMDKRKKPSIDELPMLPDEPNCRCYDTPVLHPPEEFKNDPQLQADFQNAAGNAIPDPQVYSQWFDQADVGRRKMAVGAKRYN
jgi:SPP1 gp7 family putative phage head morphogenesis protein